MFAAFATLGIFVQLFLIILFVLWFLLPFAVFGIKEKLNEGNSHLEKIVAELTKLSINSADIQTENKKTIPTEQAKPETTQPDSSEKAKQHPIKTTKAELDAVKRLESDGFTIKKYAVGTASCYWDCQKGSLSFKARTVDELVIYSEQ
jgi:regulator of replication initiation timing|tara:strand:- start:46 stop:489 length:444 start_codon:yes stop_codon:yes gene_type:complete